MSKHKNNQKAHSATFRLASQAKKPPEKKRIFFFGGSLLVVILVLAAGALYLQSIRPEKVLTSAFMHIVADVGEERPLTTSGEAVYVLKNNPLVTITVSFDGRTAGPQAAAQADVKLQIDTWQLESRAEVIFAGDGMYIKAESLKKLLQDAAAANPDLATYVKAAEPFVTKLDGAWVQLSQADIESFAGVQSGMTEKCTAIFRALMADNSSRTQLEAAFAANQFLTVLSAPKGIEILVKDSFHYTLQFNAPHYQKFLLQATRIPAQAMAKDDCGLSPVADQSSDQNGATNQTIELWVHKRSRRVQKLRVYSEAAKNSIDVTAELRWGAAGGVITPPSKYRPFKEVLAEFQTLQQSLPINTSGS